MSEADDWAPVKQAAPQEDWTPVLKTDPMPDALQLSVPEAFLDRVKAGQALTRITQGAIKEGREGSGQGTPTGFEDATLNHLIDLGIFHDPLKSTPGPIQMMNEGVMIPAAKAWEAITRATAAGIHGAGGAIGQVVTEFGGSQGSAERAKNEIINFGNWAMIEGGMGRFSRPSVGPEGAVDHAVGGLPVAEDFASAGRVMESPHAETNLKRMWSEDGIHPAEAVHDAQGDAFLKNEITAPRTDDMETIGPAAVKVGGEVYTGQTHLIALETAAKKLGVDVTELFDRKEGDPGFITADDGFVTSKGRYVQREEASEIARKADQIKEEFSRTKYLAAEELKPPQLTQEDMDVLTETGGKPGNLGAAATDPPLTPISTQPAKPPGRLAAAFKDAADTLLDIGRDAQMLTAPMARGTRDSMAMAKDFANSLRRNRWDWSRIDDDIQKRFDVESRARMWNAADEESVSLQLKEPEHMREHQGLATLEPAERALVDEMQTRAQNAWVRARDIGMVEGEGLPSYTPRMVMNVGTAFADDKALPLNSIGSNLKIRTAQMLKRSHMTVEETERAAKDYVGMRAALKGKSVEEINAAIDKVAVARDIRALPMATAKLEDAIAGRTLINNIKKYGDQTGTETIAEGAIPAGETKFFTLDHPAFRTWRPQFKEGKAVVDAEGNTVFEQVPIYVHGDFEGPLRAVLQHKSGPLYGGMMALKGKTMSLIMNSPMIHNAVEWGRALPAMPGKVATFKVYFEGNRAKRDVPLMHEAIDNGLVPIGHRFFNQDINSIMEAPDLTPGRSWTAKLLGFVPGLFDEGAGNAVKGAIDKAGNFWHNTLLWDRVADLQAGLYTNFRADAMAKGIDQQTASRMAAHFANRYAGSLPKEAMSDGATKIANMLMFSRSFTMGNLGVLKDVFTGLPKDVLAQIERDAGFGAGSIENFNPEAATQAVTYAKSMARRKAMAVVGMDMALMYVGNSLLQNAMNVMFNDSSLDKETHGYVERFLAKMQAVKEHPLELTQPLRLLSDLSATSENEPGKQERIHVGNAANGTAIYMRNPAGKIGEEFIGYMTGPLDMMRKKLGTVARPAWQIMSNDAGFGRKVYDPDADTPGKYLANIGRIAAHLAGSQLPQGQIGAFSDLVKGEGDAKVNAMQAFGPFAGVTFAKGAPGGPAVGEMYAAKTQHEFQVNKELPDIRKQIQRGDLDGALKRMQDLNIPAGLQRFYVRTSLDPSTRMSSRAVKDFYLQATPEQRARFERARQAAPQP